MSEPNKKEQSLKAAAIEGFILSSRWRDTPAAMELELWLATDESPVCIKIVAQQAVCFFLAEDAPKLQTIIKTLKHSVQATTKTVDLKHFSNKPVHALYCAGQKQLRAIKDHCREQNIPLFEDNIKPVDRYLMERFITAGVRINNSQGIKQHKQFRSLSTDTLAACRYQPKLKVLSLDIETSMDLRQLYSIAALTEEQSVVFMVGECEPFDNNTTIVSCQTERDCLQHFLQWFHHADPDIIIGWHVVQFDCWVLQKMADRLQVPLTLGRAKQRANWRQDSDNEHRRYISLAGRVVLDGIELLRTAFYTFERYSLQHVAEQVLGKGKLIQSDDRGGEITDLFHHDKSKLAAYNLQDCQLVWEIFEKLDLLNFAIERSHLTGLPLDRSGGSVASFDYAYLPRLHRAGYIAPNLGELRSSVVSPGGYVMNSRPGLYRQVLVLDFKSLYPSIIRTFNIDPFAFWYAQHQSLTGKDIIPGFNGAFFARDKSLLPGIIDELWRARDQAKREQNQSLSQAIKIIMNSFYGVLGSQGCRFFDPRVCSSITLRGHEILQRSRDWIEAQGYQVIYGDTDSVFVWLGDDCSNEQAQTVGKQLQVDLNQWWQQHLREEFALDSALEIEFETHYTRFLMPTIRGSEEGSKKRYAGIVRSQDGQGQWREAIVFKGLENVRADWTPLAKDFQLNLYQKVFSDEPYEAYIRQVVAKLNAGDLDAELVYQKKLRRPLSQYIKSNPPHVKAARRFEQASQTIMRRGDRIEYVLTLNGPEPIAYRQSAIDYQHYIDKQLKPIADSLLNLIDDNFDRITHAQMVLI